MKTHLDNQGRYHREDGPAYEADDGSWAWYKHGRLHRTDGPAVRLVYGNGQIEEQFWVLGVEHEAARTLTAKHSEYT